MLNLHYSRSPHFSSVLHCLANLALVKLQCGSGSGSGSFILDFSLLSGSWPWESKFCTHVSKPLCKQQKQLIDRAKSDDVHLTGNSSFSLLFWFIRRHFNQNFSWETVSFSVSSLIKLASGISSGVRATWSSAMLVIFNLPRGLLSLTSMQLPFFSGNGVLRKKPKKKIQNLNGIWTRDLAIPVRCSNQATKLWSHWCWEVDNYVFICSRDEMNVTNVYEVNHIWELRKWILAVVNAIRHLLDDAFYY